MIDASSVLFQQLCSIGEVENNYLPISAFFDVIHTSHNSLISLDSFSVHRSNFIDLQQLEDLYC